MKQKVTDFFLVLTSNKIAVWLSNDRLSRSFAFIIIFCLIPGVPEEQSAERRSHSEVQTEKDGDVSDAQQEDQERTAQSEPPNGVFASKDPRNREMTLTSQLILENEWTVPLFDCYKKKKRKILLSSITWGQSGLCFLHKKHSFRWCF